VSGALYKVLRAGESWHGGAHRWSLPTLADDGTWTPGEWTPAVAPVLCETGWHLTRDPARWWGAGDVAAYLTETSGAVTCYDDGDGKCAVGRCRLLRPLTRDELAELGVYTEGEHEARSGIAHASGSATVTAYGSATVTAYGSATVTAYDSATVTAYDSATVRAYDSATVRAYGSATVTAYDSATVTAYGSATVTAYGSATVRAYDSATVTAYDSATVTAYDSATVTAYGSATVRAYGSATVRAYDSATVRAYDSARAHVSGRSICTAWSGTSLVLTRSDRGVIVDQRGPTTKTYVKRRGVGGWRYDETAGTWSQRNGVQS
jgi:hypothetical protein